MYQNMFYANVKIGRFLLPSYTVKVLYLDMPQGYNVSIFFVVVEHTHTDQSCLPKGVIIWLIMFVIIQNYVVMFSYQKKTTSMVYLN